MNSTASTDWLGRTSSSRGLPEQHCGDHRGRRDRDEQAQEGTVESVDAGEDDGVEGDRRRRQSRRRPGRRRRRAAGDRRRTKARPRCGPRGSSRHARGRRRCARGAPRVRRGRPGRSRRGRWRAPPPARGPTAARRSARRVGADARTPATTGGSMSQPRTWYAGRRPLGVGAWAGERCATPTETASDGIRNGNRSTPRRGRDGRRGEHRQRVADEAGVAERGGEDHGAALGRVAPGSCAAPRRGEHEQELATTSAIAASRRASNVNVV